MQRIGKYEVVRHLATGGMGEVLLARQLGPAGFTRTVVLKRLLPHLAKDPVFVQMFLNEARVVSLLSHPNVAQIFELGEAGDTFFIAMEFVHGHSLHHVIRALARRQRLPGPALSARIVIQALKGLHHAHSLRTEGRPTPVVHRDMSPDNILVGFNGISRVIDFGIARAADTVSTTRTGTIKGKFAYIAPERFQNEKSDVVDARVDVYAMGVVAYECLTGVRPFRGNSDAALVGAILQTEAAPAHEVNAAVPPALSAVVAKALAKDPAQRFTTALEFADALEAWLASSGQAVGDAEIAAFMRSLFGDEADSNPAMLPPSPVAAEALTEAAAAPVRRRGAPVFVAAALAVLGLGVGLAYAALRPPPAESLTPVAAPPPAPVPRDEPPPTTKGKPGRVSFRVKPWGEIWLGDEKLGVTPNVFVERPPGRYTFTVKHPDFPPRSLDVELLPDSEVAVKVDLTTPP